MRAYVKIGLFQNVLPIENEYYVDMYVDLLLYGYIGLLQVAIQIHIVMCLFNCTS